MWPQGMVFRDQAALIINLQRGGKNCGARCVLWAQGGSIGIAAVVQLH